MIPIERLKTLCGSSVANITPDVLVCLQELLAIREMAPKMASAEDAAHQLTSNMDGATFTATYEEIVGALTIRDAAWAAWAAQILALTEENARLTKLLDHSADVVHGRCRPHRCFNFCKELRAALKEKP